MEMHKWWFKMNGMKRGTKVDFLMVDEKNIEEEIIILWKMVWSYKFDRLAVFLFCFRIEFWFLCVKELKNIL